MQLDIERFCATNPVARYIVDGVDIGKTATTYPTMRAALGQLAGSDVLEDADVLTRYILVQRLYTEVEQKTAHMLGDMGLQVRAEARGEFSEQDVRLARVIKDAQAQLPAWRHDGACNGVVDDRFFPERGQSTRPAKDICAGCKVRETCLEYALENGEKFGIWGGTSERERRRIRRQRKLAKVTSTVVEAASTLAHSDPVGQAVYEA